jgi:hypothetical protein
MVNARFPTTATLLALMDGRWPCRSMAAHDSAPTCLSALSGSPPSASVVRLRLSEAQSEQAHVSPAARPECADAPVDLELRLQSAMSRLRT